MSVIEKENDMEGNIPAAQNLSHKFPSLVNSISGVLGRVGKAMGYIEEGDQRLNSIGENTKASTERIIEQQQQLKSLQSRLESILNEKARWEESREEAYQEEIAALQAKHSNECQALKSQIDHLVMQLEKLQSEHDALKQKYCKQAQQRASSHAVECSVQEEEAEHFQKPSEGCEEDQQMHTHDEEIPQACVSNKSMEDHDDTVSDDMIDETVERVEEIMEQAECKVRSSISPADVPLPQPTEEEEQELMKEDTNADAQDATGKCNLLVEGDVDEFENQVTEKVDGPAMDSTNKNETKMNIKQEQPPLTAADTILVKVTELPQEIECSVPEASPSKLRPSKRRKTREKVREDEDSCDTNPAKSDEKESVVKMSKFFAKEIKECRKALKDLDPDWTKRSNAITKLEKLVKEDNVMRMDGWTTQAEKLREALSIQLTDLRSSIIKQMCNLLIAMSKSAGSKFDDLFVYLFPSLQKLLYVSIKVIANAADQCIKQILESTHTPKVLPAIFVGVKDSHAACRMRSMEYLSIYVGCSSVPGSCKEDVLREFENTCIQVTQDGDGPTRAAARQFYEAFCTHWADRGKLLFDKLSAQTQKTVTQERKKATAKGGPSKRRR